MLKGGPQYSWLKLREQPRMHRIINININTGGYHPPVPYERGVMMKTMEMNAAPAVEAGTSKITVTINGSVQFF